MHLTLLLALSLAQAVMPKCGDPELLDQRLDELLMRLDAGLSIAGVTSLAGEPVTPLEPYVPIPLEAVAPPRTARRAGFLPSVRDGSRTAYRYVDCFFDQSGTMLECRPWRRRDQSQTVNADQIKHLKKGMSPSQVRGLLCPAGKEAVEANGDLVWDYSYDDATLIHNYGALVLRFDKSQKLREPHAYRR